MVAILAQAFLVQAPCGLSDWLSNEMSRHVDRRQDGARWPWLPSRPDRALRCLRCTNVLVGQHTELD